MTIFVESVRERLGVATLSAARKSARRDLDGFFRIGAGLCYLKREKIHSDFNNYFFLKNSPSGWLKLWPGARHAPS